MSFPTAKEVRDRWEAVSPVTNLILTDIKNKLIDSEYVRKFAPNFTMSFTGYSPTVGDNNAIVQTLKEAGYEDVRITISEEVNRPKLVSVSFKLP